MISAEALAPIRAALLHRARCEADRSHTAAEADAQRGLAAARDRARAIRSEAEEQGRAAARADAVAEVAAAGRDARRTVLQARRRAYDGLRDAVRDRLAADDDLHAAFAARITRALGPRAQLADVAGGLAGNVDGRRVECTVDALADEALDRLGPVVEALWAP